MPSSTPSSSRGPGPHAATFPGLSGADGALLLVAIVWGTSYGVAKGALAFYPVFGFLAVRFLLAAALLAPVALRGTTPAQRRAALCAGLPLGVLLMAIFVCETYGVAHTQASHAALLISLCVVLTPFAEWLLLGRRPAPAVFCAAAVSLLGVALLTGGWRMAWGRGDALVLAAAVLRALAACATSRLARRHAQAPVLLLTAVQSAVVGGGCLLAAASLPGGLPALPGQAAFWAACLYLVLGCTVFAFIVQNRALAQGAPSRVGLLMGTEPAWGALFAVVWLGESLGAAGWLGAALIVGAALWTLRWRPGAP
ncbi:DMT family transporter [Acidovorax sp. NCPPB 2350]|nr:DMT family transporter [Acidovorax sp. NCPPB 2350]